MLSKALTNSINIGRLRRLACRPTRRRKRSGIAKRPDLHDFRPAFALNMLRNGVDVFVLQKLLGHSDLQVMRRYLVQNNTDTQAAHMRGSPVDNGL